MGQVRAEDHELVTIEGFAPRMQSFNLPHDVYCKSLGECHCSKGKVVSSFRSTADQQKHLKVSAKLFNTSLTIGFRKKATVKKAVLKCPEVKAALESKPRKLRVRS